VVVVLISIYFSGFPSLYFPYSSDFQPWIPNRITWKIATSTDAWVPLPKIPFYLSMVRPRHFYV
jgi:hypothetical protein